MSNMSFYNLKKRPERIEKFLELFEHGELFETTEGRIIRIKKIFVNVPTLKFHTAIVLQNNQAVLSETKFEDTTFIDEVVAKRIDGKALASPILLLEELQRKNVRVSLNFETEQAVVKATEVKKHVLLKPLNTGEEFELQIFSELKNLITAIQEDKKTTLFDVGKGYIHSIPTNYIKEKEIITKIIDIIKERNGKLSMIKDIKFLGGQRVHRPINFTEEARDIGMTLGNTRFLDGFINASSLLIKSEVRTISDIEITMTDSKKEYISLKKGNCTAFGNIGLRRFFGGIGVDLQVNDDGKKFLEALRVDEQLLKEVVLKYKQNGSQGKAIVPITKFSSSLFLKFIESAVGVGYIYVHKGEKDKVFFMDSMKLDKMCANPRNVIATYPIDGSGKYVSVSLETDGFLIDMRLRAKEAGKIIPSHLIIMFREK